MNYIVMHGGRGASSSYGGDRNTGGNGRPMKFYDKTNKYQGMSKHEFENAIRDKTVEYIGVFNDKGELIVAGTSYSPNAVGVPTNHPRWNEVHDLTHNHPYKPANEPNRTIGATFSTADVENHIALDIKGETRQTKTLIFSVQKLEQNKIKMLFLNIREKAKAYGTEIRPKR